MTNSTRLALSLITCIALASPTLAFAQARSRTSQGTSTGSAAPRSPGASSEGSSSASSRVSVGEPGARVSPADRGEPAEGQRRAPAGGTRTGSAAPRSGGVQPSGGRAPGTVSQTRGVPGSGRVGTAAGRTRNGAPITGTAGSRFLYPSRPVYPYYPSYPYYPYYGYPYYPYYGYGYYPYYGNPYYGWGYPYGWGFSIGFGYGYGCCGYPGYGYGGYYGGGHDRHDADYDEDEPSRSMGSIRLKAKPASAQVFIDGALVGKVDDFDGFSDHLSLDAGRHQIEIRADGYETYSGEIDVEAGKTLTERISLKKKS